MSRQNFATCILCGKHRRPWLINDCKHFKGLVCDSCCDKCFKKHGNKCLGLKKSELEKTVKEIRRLIGLRLREEDLLPYATD